MDDRLPQMFREGFKTQERLDQSEGRSREEKGDRSQEVGTKG